MRTETVGQEGDYRAKRPSQVRAGNRARSEDGRLLAGSGGSQRGRLSTTLPLEALDQLDALALEHGLQRNEVLTLALAALAHPEHHHPQAARRFTALAMSWEGFPAGVQPPARGRRRRS